MAKLGVHASFIFVLFAAFWYYYMTIGATCYYMDTGEPCDDTLSKFFIPMCCGLPVIMLSMKFFSLAIADPSQRVSMVQAPLQQEGTTIMRMPQPAEKTRNSLSEKASTAVTYCMMAFTACIVLLVLIGGVLLGYALLCGLSMGTGCSDDDFEGFISAYKIVNSTMWFSYWIFILSAVVYLLSRQPWALKLLEEWTGSNGGESEEKISIKCPSCNEKLRYPATFEGELKCPSCEHQFNPRNLES